jgi:hypothetical protein
MEADSTTNTTKANDLNNTSNSTQEEDRAKILSEKLKIEFEKLEEENGN